MGGSGGIGGSSDGFAGMNVDGGSSGSGFGSGSGGDKDLTVDGVEMHRILALIFTVEIK